MLWRYPVESGVGAVLGLLIFVGILHGLRLVNGAAALLDAHPASVAWSYASWLIVAGCLAAIPSEIQNDAQAGHVEAAFQSAIGTTRLFLLRGLASFVVTLLTTVVTVGLALALTGTALRVTPSLLGVMLMLALTALGLGMATGGLALVLKKVNVLLALVSFLLLPLFMAPLAPAAVPSPLSQCLPMRPALVALKRLASGQADGLTIGQWAVLGAQAACMAALGVLVFDACRRLTKKRGTVAHY